MILIACVDQKNGMTLNGRRQTNDRAVRRLILKEAYPKKIIMAPSCATQFNKREQRWILCRANPMESASEGSYCMIETEQASSYVDRIERIVLYRWNTVYPADVFFDLPLHMEWDLISQVMFDGFSHPDVVQEIYIRRKKR